MEVVRGVDQLGGDAKTITGLADAALQHGGDTERLPDLARANRLSPKSKRGRARGDVQIPDLGQPVEDFLCDAVTQISLVVGLAHILEGEYGDGGLVGARRRNPGVRCRL